MLNPPGTTVGTTAQAGQTAPVVTLLESTGQYDHNLTLHMAKIFLQAGGEGKLAKDFCHEICTLKKSVSDELLKIRFMTKDDANNHMVAEVAYLLSHL
jgi:hypothetical protein